MNALLTTLLFLLFAYAETFQCKVVGVTDDGTILCVAENQKQSIVKPYGVIMPEPEQPYGKLARINFSNWFKNIRYRTIEIYSDLKHSNVFVDVYKKKDDIYIGKIYYPMYLVSVGRTREEDVSLWLLRNGLAWYYPFDGENLQYQQVEQEAKKAKRFSKN